jgi:hypothetical protein
MHAPSNEDRPCIQGIKRSLPQPASTTSGIQSKHAARGILDHDAEAAHIVHE